MIFMSQSGITDRSRESDWDAWYLEHLAIIDAARIAEAARKVCYRA